VSVTDPPPVFVTFRTTVLLPFATTVEAAAETPTDAAGGPELVGLSLLLEQAASASQALAATAVRTRRFMTDSSDGDDRPVDPKPECSRVSTTRQEP
jgi:hypothetical protein